MPYEMIHTDTDVLRERYIYGFELTDKGYPIIPPCTELVPSDLDPVPIFKSRNNLHPQKSICHMFVDDSKFEPLWNQPHKQIETLKNFQFVCAPDFSMWASMPLPMQHYNKYRLHALSCYLWLEGVNIIPVAVWNDLSSFEWCFDGMPKNSVIAIGTNGISKDGRNSFRAGFYEMIRQLKPIQIVWVGQKIEVDTDVPIVYFDGYSQQINKRLKDGKS